LFADDYQLITPNGSELSRADYLGHRTEIASPDRQHYRWPSIISHVSTTSRGWL